MISGWTRRYYRLCEIRVRTFRFVRRIRNGTRLNRLVRFEAFGRIPKRKTKIFRNIDAFQDPVFLRCEGLTNASGHHGRRSRFPVGKTIRDPIGQGHGRFLSRLSLPVGKNAWALQKRGRPPSRNGPMRFGTFYFLIKTLITIDVIIQYSQ